MKLHIALMLTLGLAAGTLTTPNVAQAGDEIKGWHVEQSVDIMARPEIVYAYVADLNQWPNWTVWNAEMDPTTKWTFTGEPSTVGHTMEWDGKEMGWGRLTLTSADPATGVTYDMWMMKEKNPPGKGTLVFTAIDGGTRVTWTDAGPLKGMGKMFKKKINSMLTVDFTANLANLKAKAEADELSKRAEEEAARVAAEAAAKAAAEAKAAEEAAAAAAKAAEEAAAAAKAAEEAAKAKGKKKK